jgi:hypothetical protein
MKSELQQVFLDPPESLEDVAAADRRHACWWRFIPALVIGGTCWLIAILLLAGDTIQGPPNQK